MQHIKKQAIKLIHEELKQLANDEIKAILAGNEMHVLVNCNFDEDNFEEELRLVNTQLRDKLFAFLQYEREQNRDLYDRVHAILILLTKYWPRNKLEDAEEGQFNESRFECPYSMETLTDENSLCLADGYQYHLASLSDAMQGGAFYPVNDGNAPLITRDRDYAIHRGVQISDLQPISKKEKWKEIGRLTGAMVNILELIAGIVGQIVCFCFMIGLATLTPVNVTLMIIALIVTVTSNCSYEVRQKIYKTHENLGEKAGETLWSIANYFTNKFLTPSPINPHINRLLVLPEQRAQEELPQEGPEGIPERRSSQANVISILNEQQIEPMAEEKAAPLARQELREVQANYFGRLLAKQRVLPQIAGLSANLSPK